MSESPYRTKKGGLAIGALVSAFFSVVIYEWGLEVIETINLVLGGFADAISGIGEFFGTSIDWGFFGLSELIEGAFEAHGAWVTDTFGVFAPVFLTIEIAVLVWFLLVIVKVSLSQIGGVAS